MYLQLRSGPITGLSVSTYHANNWVDLLYTNKLYQEKLSSQLTMSWFRWRWRGGWNSIITEYLVDVEELCNRSPAVNYFQLVKVLVLVGQRCEIITFCPPTQPSADHSITSTFTNNNSDTAGALGWVREKF